MWSPRPGRANTARTKRVKVTHDDEYDEMLFRLDDFGFIIYTQGFFSLPYGGLATKIPAVWQNKH